MHKANANIKVHKLSQFSINKDPNAAFAEYYMQAKMLTAQILLNVNFEHKADAGAQLERANAMLTRCKQNANFDVLAAARTAKKIDNNMRVIIAAYKNAA